MQRVDYSAYLVLHKHLVIFGTSVWPITEGRIMINSSLLSVLLLCILNNNNYIHRIITVILNSSWK